MTFQIAGTVTVLAVLLGYPLCYWMLRLPKLWQGLAVICVLVPFWTSLLVRTYAWLVLLQRRGLVNTTLQGLGLIEQPLALMYNVTGTTIGMTHILLPFLVLPLFASMQRIDRDLLRAAAALGATPALRVLAGVLSALAAGADSGRAARVRPVDRLLRDAAAARRRVDRDGRPAHPAQYRAVQLLGRRKRRVGRAARYRACRCSG